MELETYQLFMEVMQRLDRIEKILKKENPDSEPQQPKPF